MDVYRTNDLVKTVKKSQHPPVLKYFSPGKLDQGTLAPRTGDARYSKGTIHADAMTPVGWSGAAYGDQSRVGKCRLGHIVGPMSPNLSGPCHLAYWASKITRKLVKSSVGGEVYAVSEMLDHMFMLREYYGHFTDLLPGMVGLEKRESLFTHLEKNELITEKFLARHF